MGTSPTYSQPECLVRSYFDMYLKLIADRFALTQGFHVTPYPKSYAFNPKPSKPETTIFPTPKVST